MHWFCYRLKQSRLLVKSVTMFCVMRGSVSYPVGCASFCLRLHRTAPDKPIILLFTFVFTGAYLIPVLFFPPCSGLCRLMSSEIISIKRVTCHSDGSRWWFGMWNLWQQLSGPPEEFFSIISTVRNITETVPPASRHHWCCSTSTTPIPPPLLHSLPHVSSL